MVHNTAENSSDNFPFILQTFTIAWIIIKIIIIIIIGAKANKK